MTDLLILGLAMAIMVFGSFAARGVGISDNSNKVAWTAIGIALVVAASAKNPWMGILIALHGIGILFLRDAERTLHRTVYPCLAYTAGYLVLADRLQLWMVVPILWTLVGIGLFLVAWMFYAFTQPDKYQQDLLFPFTIYDHYSQYPHAGQGQHNHTQCLAAICLAAALGLALLGKWAALAAAPFLLLPFYYCQFRYEKGVRGTPGQGVLHAIVLLVGLLWLWDWRWGLLAAVQMLAAGLWIGKPWAPRRDWWDSNRFEHWRLAVLDIWWPAVLVPNLQQQMGAQIQHAERIEHQVAAREIDQKMGQMLLGLAEQELHATNRLLKYIGAMPLTAEEVAEAKGELRQSDTFIRWRTRLLGFGTNTWLSITAPFTTMRERGIFYTSAHNEYLHQLVEHGALGALALTGYVLNGLWHAYHGGPEGQAVFLVALVLCSIAAMNFPWTHLHEVKLSNGQSQKFGAPALVAISLIVAALAELF